MAKKPTPLDYYLDKYENELLRKRYEENVAKTKSSPEYIRGEKMRKLLQHNAEFQKQHKNTEISIEDYTYECMYQAEGLLELVKTDLQGKEETFKNMAEIITYYKTNFKFISEYSTKITKADSSLRINDTLFLQLIDLNPYFLCLAPICCFLAPNLPIDKIDEECIKKYIQPRVEKSNLIYNKLFIANYGKYFNTPYGV